MSFGVKLPKGGTVPVYFGTEVRSTHITLQGLHLSSSTLKKKQDILACDSVRQ